MQVVRFWIDNSFNICIYLLTKYECYFGIVVLLFTLSLLWAIVNIYNYNMSLLQRTCTIVVCFYQITTTEKREAKYRKWTVADERTTNLTSYLPENKCLDRRQLSSLLLPLEQSERVQGHWIRSATSMRQFIRHLVCPLLQLFTKHLIWCAHYTLRIEK